MLRKLVLMSVLAATALLLACASTQVQVETVSVKPKIDCNQPLGREYVCYSEEECGKYFRGYGAVAAHRIHMQKYHDWYKGVVVHVIHINVFDDKNSWYWLGRIEAVPYGEDKIYMKMWLDTYDIDCNKLHGGYKEGTTRQLGKCKKEKSYEQNSFKLKTLGR